VGGVRVDPDEGVDSLWLEEDELDELVGVCVVAAELLPCAVFFPVAATPAMRAVAPTARAASHRVA
jgi:hypothetical protein